MRTIPSALLADLQADCTTLAFLWTIEQADGVIIRGTEHDQDVTLPTGLGHADKFAGTYPAIANITLQDVQSNADLTVDNSAVIGAFPDIDPSASPRQATVIDVSAAAVEAGLLDQAPVTVLVCNWAAPAHGFYIEKVGTLGKIDRDSDGKYTTEVRGLTQLLSQTIVRTYSATCNVVRFGDARCKFNVATVTVTGDVASGLPADTRGFSCSLDGTPAHPASFIGGVLTFTSGANAGFFREVKTDPFANGNAITFWEPFPNPIAMGDEFTLEAGCDRSFEMCKMYGNTANNRAFGRYIPGILAITAGPIKPQGLP